MRAHSFAAIEVEVRPRGNPWRVADRAYHDPRVRAVAAFTVALAATHYLEAGAGARMLFVAFAVWIAERHGRHLGFIASAAGVAGYALVSGTNDPQPILGAFLQLGISLALVSRICRHLAKANNLVAIASHDALTDCANRKTLRQFADDQLTRCIAREVPFTLAVIDCDRFKALNDTHGHAYGDEVLRMLARFVRANFGQTALLGRTGGDEFVLAAPGLNASEVEARLERASAAFGDATLVRGGKASFSYGLADSEENGVFLDRYFRHADEDMYRRKQAKKALLGLIA
jgi:diguanylate cyclase (GGDEF)-like protein